MLVSWSDSDYVSDKANLESVTGGVPTMEDTVVQWMCKKQTGAWLPKIKAEFVSASRIGRESLGLTELVSAIGFRVKKPS
uniref:Uncharacterized protein n=1 Tax=Peronospora matthiolae TaxID=2874970 RepID=A0AAV1US86_9STRA